MRRYVYSGRLKLSGDEHEGTLIAANNYALSLFDLQRFKEARSLMRKTMPVAQRVLGNCHYLTLKSRWIYARALYRDAGASLDDVREAVAMLEDLERVVRRVFGGAHPFVAAFEESLQNAREALRARETPSGSA